jgi:hypothetical protein
VLNGQAIFGEGTIGEYTTSGATVNASLISGLYEPTSVAVAAAPLPSPLAAVAVLMFLAVVCKYRQMFRPNRWMSGGISLKVGQGSGSLFILLLGFAAPLWILPRAASGQIFVSNNFSGTISEYTTSGTPINTSLITGLNSPQGLAISGSDLFVANSGNATVGEYTTSGTPVTTWSVSVFDANVYGIAVSGSDVFVTDGSGVCEYTTSGTPVSVPLISGLNTTSAIAVSGSNLFVVNGGFYNADSGTVGEYTTSGTPVNPSLISGLDENGYDNFGIAVSGSNLFVTNDATGTIGEYTTAGTPINTSLISAGYPGGLAISGSDLFVDSAAYSGSYYYPVIGEYTTSGTPINTSLISEPGGPNGDEGIAVVVPEPSALWPLAAAGMVLAIRPRRNSVCS